MRKLKLEELGRLSEEQFKNSEKTPAVVVLDNIRSLHNVGSVFRIADAFRLEKIYLCGITGTPPHREINKTALGATETVDWEYFQDPLEVIDILNRNEYQTYCVEQTTSSTMLHNFTPDPDKKYAFILGNEVFGVQDSLIEKVGNCIEIPQFGTKHSLNVSVAAGIVIWDYVSKANSGPPV